MRRSPFFSATEREESQPPSQRLDGAYLLPAMAIVATAMVTTAFFPGFDRYYPVKVIAAVLVLAFYRRQLLRAASGRFVAGRRHRLRRFRALDGHGTA